MSEFGKAPIKAEGEPISVDPDWTGPEVPDPGGWIEFRYHENAPMDLTGLADLKKALKNIPEELRDATIETFVVECWGDERPYWWS